MRADIRQYVDTEECRRCDGCCRFDGQYSSWRPVIRSDECAAIAREYPALSRGEAEMRAPDSRLTAVSHNGHHVCRFFDCAGNGCSAYRARPFECRLYPFMFVRSNERLAVAAHLRCPAVAQRRHTAAFAEYVDYLREYFLSADGAACAAAYAPFIGEYDCHQDELECLFFVEPDSGHDMLAQQPVFEKYRAQHSHTLSSYAFASLFLWKDYFEFTFERVNGALCVFARNMIGSFLYLPPLGAGVPLAVIDGCFKTMHAVNNGSGVSRIENVEEQYVPRFPESRYAITKKSDEYVYRRQDVVSLAGNAFKSKRALYNQCVARHHPAYAVFTDDMSEACMALYDRWARNRTSAHDDEMYRHMVRENRIVHQRALTHHKELNLVGRVAVVDGAVAAYSFGCALTADTVCILLEITDLSLKGLSVFIFRELCSDPQLQAYSFINVMDDYGLENIRATKQSFRPVRVIPSYVVTERRHAHSLC